MFVGALFNPVVLFDGGVYGINSIIVHQVGITLFVCVFSLNFLEMLEHDIFVQRGDWGV